MDGIFNSFGLQSHLITFMGNHITLSLDQTFSLGFMNSADFYFLLYVFCLFDELRVVLDRKALCFSLFYLGIVFALGFSDFL